MIQTRFSEFEEVKANIIRGTIEDNEAFVNLSQDYLNELSDIFETLYRIYLDPENISDMPRPGEIPMLSSILKTGYSVYTLVLSGLYREATAILRMIMEDFQVLLFFHYHPERSNEWISNKISMNEVLTLIKKTLKDFGVKDVKKHFWVKYSTTSKYVHSSAQSLHEVLDKDDQTNSITLGPAYNSHKCDTALFRLCDLLNFVSNMMVSIHEEDLNKMGYSRDHLNQIESRFNTFSGK
jgi:hypothetical protein